MILENYLFEIQNDKITLYHGSPRILKSLTPTQAKGRSKFEDQKAVFLTKTDLHSALYAIGKTLKGKTYFGVRKNKLVIVGNHQPKNGYVYEVQLDKKDVTKGPEEQYSYPKTITSFKKKKVFAKDYKKYIVNVKDMNELLKHFPK